jgi:hypothetical protein
VTRRPVTPLRVIALVLLAPYGLWLAFTATPADRSLNFSAGLFSLYTVVTVARWWMQGREHDEYIEREGSSRSESPPS